MISLSGSWCLPLLGWELERAVYTLSRSDMCEELLGVQVQLSHAGYPDRSVGLSSMWQSQVGAHLLYERLPDGGKGAKQQTHDDEAGKEREELCQGGARLQEGVA
jgi:hypothetical protein